MREQCYYIMWTVLLQCMDSNFCLCIVNLLFMRWKKKGRKRERWFQLKPNAHYISEVSQTIINWFFSTWPHSTFLCDVLDGLTGLASRTWPHSLFNPSFSYEEISNIVEKKKKSMLKLNIKAGWWASSNTHFHILNNLTHISTCVRSVWIELIVIEIENWKLKIL